MLTRGPRWPWIAHLIFLDYSRQFFFFFFVAFREEFTRISLCLYSARSLHSLIPCLLTDQNFKINSEKGHSRNISMRLFQNLTNSSQFFFFFFFFFFGGGVAFKEEFTRISLCLYSARILHSLIPCLLTDQNFKIDSEKGHSRNISMRLFQNLTNSFREDNL